MLFQYGALFDSLSLSENIAFTDYMDNKINYSRKVKSLMADVGLDASNYNKYPSEVSGGMKKRAALARALYKNPKVIFLDEPTTGLDPINSDLINDLIIKVIKKRKITAVTITHDIKSAIKTGDNFYFIHKGITQEEGRCDKILTTKNKIFKSFITGARY
jgi:phospholipid/cholesterol/gamma-HCH transport system ATP-binding protein